MSRTPALPVDVIDEALAGSRWTRDGSVIVLERELASFPEAIGFVAAVGAIAERLDHHPDIDVRYRTVRLAVTSHDLGALSQRDLDLAAAVDRLS